MVTVPCRGWLPTENVSVDTAAPVADIVIGVAASSGTETVCGFATGTTFSVRDAAAVCAGKALSLTVAVNANESDCVGVPDSTPAGESDTPAGSTPALTIHTYGAADDVNPPLAASVVKYGWLTMTPG